MYLMDFIQDCHNIRGKTQSIISTQLVSLQHLSGFNSELDNLTTKIEQNPLTKDPMIHKDKSVINPHKGGQ